MNIEIELSASELKHALGGLSKVAGKSSLPVLQCIRLAREETGLVTLQASDLDSFVTYQTDQSQMGPTHAGAWLIHLDHLAKVVKASSPNDRLVVVVEGQHVFLRSFIGHTPVEEKVESIPLDEWPGMLKIKQAASRLESGLKAALQEALDCASKDPAHLALNGAFLDVTQPGLHYVIGCDSRHLYTANSFRFELEDSIIIPNHKFLAWSGFMNDGDWSLSVLPGTEKERTVIKLSSKHWEFVTRAIEAAYPNWKQVVPPPERQKTVLVLSNEAAACVSQVAPRLPGDACTNQPITLQAGESKLLLRGRHRKSEPWTDIAVPGVGIIGPAAEVMLNRLYLLKAMRLGLREVELSGPGVPIVFRNANKQLFVAPLGHEDAKTSTGNAPAVNEACQKPPCPSVRLDSDSHSEEQEHPEEQQDTTVEPPAECSEREGSHGCSASEHASSYAAIMEQIEWVKTALTDVLGHLDKTLGLLKAAEAEQDLRDTEIESIKATLRSLRNVEL